MIFYLYGLYGREDLMIPDQNCIIELKATKTDKTGFFFSYFVI